MLAWLPSIASAQPVMDLQAVDPVLTKDLYGRWELRDATGRKHCQIELQPAVTLGGQRLHIEKACHALFPIMQDITAWRLLENWVIVFSDATRQSRIRFYTPDNRYVADPEVDGISTLIKQRQAGGN